MEHNTTDFKIDEVDNNDLNKSYDSLQKKSSNNKMDENITEKEIKELYRKEDLYSRHEIIKNIYQAFIKITKPCILILLIFVAVFLYPLSRVELPCEYGYLIADYLKILFELVTAVTSFFLGAIVSNWVSSKFDDK